MGFCEDVFGMSSEEMLNRLDVQRMRNAPGIFIIEHPGYLASAELKAFKDLVENHLLPALPEKSMVHILEGGATIKRLADVEEKDETKTKGEENV